MKIFLDTGNINEIREAAALGVLDGVTTNPTLIAKEGKPFKPTVLEICKIVGGPVSVEVVGTDSGTMCREGQEFVRPAAAEAHFLDRAGWRERQTAHRWTRVPIRPRPRRRTPGRASPSARPSCR